MGTRSHLKVLAITSAVLAMACGEATGPKPSRGPNGLSAAVNKPSGTPLTAVYRDALSDGVTSDARIRPGDPTYVNGLEGVEAVILDIGNFRVSAKSPSPRKLCIDFGTQSPPPELTQPECDNGYQTSGSPDVAGGLPALAVGQAMTSASQVTWVTAGYNWFLRFGEDCAGNVVSANRVTIARLDAGTWTAESPSGSAILCKLPVKGRPATTFVGTFSMPFQLTLRLN
jgi:hypothetical protein